jgi:predicted nucleotidyltransferase
VRRRLLELAEEDGDVAAAAITGSEAVGKADEWSDIDLAFSIRGDLSAALERWTEVLYGQFAAIQHWDLPWGSTVYRVFLLPDWLEVDIAFTPLRDFGPRGPNWRTVFGETVEVEPTPPPEPGQLAGLAWHHALHARICIERGQALQAEWLIGGLREHVLALACVRLGYPARFAKGADLLPPEVIVPLEATLVRSLDEPELRRALAAASAAYVDELERSDAALAGRLRPMLAELSGSARSLRGR